MLAPAPSQHTLRKMREIAHRMAAPMILNIMVMPFIFVSPVNDWIGSRVFLCSVLSHLGFFPGGSTVGAHIDLVFIALITSAVGLAIAFGIVCAEVYMDAPDDIFTSKRTRGLAMVTIFVMFWVCGYFWSRSPRMRLGLRVTMFSLTWILTQPKSAVTSTNFTDIYLPVLITGLLSLISVLIWPLTASRAFGRQMSRAFGIAADMIDRSALDYSEGISQWRERKITAHLSRSSKKDPPAIYQSKEFLSLRNQMTSTISAMGRATAAARNEITLAYVPTRIIEKFRPYFHEFQSWMGCGMGMQHRYSSLEYMSEINTPVVHQVRQFHDWQNNSGISGDNSGQSGYQEASNYNSGREDPEEYATDGVQLKPPINIPEIRLPPLATDESDEEVPDPDLFNEKEEVPTLDPFCKELSATMRLLRVVVDFARGSSPQNPQGSAKKLAEAIRQGRSSCNAELPLGIIKEQRSLLKERFVTVRMDFNKFVARRGRSFKSDNLTTVEPLTPRASSIGSPASFAPAIEPLLGPPRLFREDMYSISLFSVSLFEIAYKLLDMLNVADEVIRIFMSHRYPYLIVSRMNWARWILSEEGVGLFQVQGLNDASLPPNLLNPHMRDDHGNDRQIMDSIFDESYRMDTYKIYARNVVYASNQRSMKSKNKSPRILERISMALHRITRLNSVVEARIALSSFFRVIKRSRHARFALKLATGVVLLSIPSILPPQGTKWWAKQHGQWMIISYIWCLESSTGDSLRIAVLRIFGTIFGCIIGLIVWEVSRGERIALAVLLVIGDIPPVALRLFSRNPPAGAVMGITVPIVALVPFLNSDTYNPGIIALIRMYMICIGIVVALMVNIIVWPYHARVVLIQQISNTTSQLQSMYLSLARQMLYAGDSTPLNAKKRFKEVERDIRARISQCWGLLSIMRNEISLVPKPVYVLDEILSRIQVLSELFVGLRIIREHGLYTVRKKAVWDVIDLRQEMISSVLLVLWIIGQSLLTHTRIPQFLPSVRRSLDELTAALALQHGEFIEKADSSSIHRQEHRQRLFDAPSLKLFAREHSTESAFHPNMVGPLTPGTPASISNAIREREQQENDAGSGANTPDISPGQQKTLETDTTLYLLVEHAILDQIIICLDELLNLTRVLLGEMRFIDG